jgi:hypothetical protein
VQEFVTARRLQEPLVLRATPDYLVVVVVLIHFLIGR